jgi:hypothetical protein
VFGREATEKGRRQPAEIRTFPPFFAAYMAIGQHLRSETKRIRNQPARCRYGKLNLADTPKMG